MANNIVSQSPSISEVKSVLAETSNSVGGLCTSPKINMWSRWKPISFNKMGDITENDLKTANFGLIPPTPSNNYETIVNTRWGYQKPIGGATSPYRIGDFRNYNRYAGAIMGVPDDFKINRTVISERVISTPLNPKGSTVLIGLEDLAGNIGGHSLRDFHYGVVFTFGRESNKMEYIQTALSPIGGTLLETPVLDATQFTIDLTQEPFVRAFGGEFTLNHLLVKNKVETLTLLSAAGANTYLSIPSEGVDNTSVMTVTAGAGSGEGEVAMNLRTIGTAPSNMVSINPYMVPNAPSFITNGNLYLGFEIKNNDNKSSVFSGIGLQMSANPNYYGINSLRLPATFMNSQGVQQNEITINAGATVNIIIGINDLLNRQGGSVAPPTQSTEIYSIISVLRNNSQIFTNQFKFKTTF